MSENFSKKIVISISGAAEVSHCGRDTLNIAKELGREIARQGLVLSTGATSGFPDYTAKGYKEAGGTFCLGLSPASDPTEHANLYLLPLNSCDITIFTGFGFPVRDIMLVKSSDAVVIGCGRIGTIHEFTVAWESNIPIGILEGPWETDEVIRDIIRNSNRVNTKVIFDSDIKRLVSRLVEMVKENKNRIEIGDNPLSTELKAKV